MIQVNFQLTEFHLPNSTGRRPSPDRGSNTCKQLTGRKWFRHEVVCSSIQSDYTSLLVFLGGEDDDGDVRSFSYLRHKFVALDIRQAKVTQD
jgi:hypothetical protein